MTTGSGARPLDVSRLPDAAMDHRSPIWWGNALLLVIETTMFGILIASYFYLRQNFEHWPPPLVTSSPPLMRPVPDLGVALWVCAASLGGLGAMVYVDIMCLRMRERPVKIGLLVMIVFGVATIALQACTFRSLHFRWDANAYASTAWTIVFFQILHELVATVESVLMAAWIFTHKMDAKHARDIRTTAIYWYWITAMWFVNFSVVFLSPRFV
jgi:cytochrome c oxidase subunit 3